MWPTQGLLREACRVTLFTRQNCRLCDQAKAVLSDVQNRRPFAYREIDLADPSSGAWRELYDFDIPVIHISKAEADEEQVSTVAKAVKLMHRFSRQQVEASMDQVEAKPGHPADE